jgi:hypothetical protein
LKSNIEWRDYCRSGKKPLDIPSNPDAIFGKDGWISWGDWLGTGRIAHGVREYQSFMKARAFARSRGFKSQGEWFEYCRSGKKPVNIPNTPQNVYANDGWSGWGDWLGTGNIATFLRKQRPFKQARAFVRTLG